MIYILLMLIAPSILILFHKMKKEAVLIILNIIIMTVLSILTNSFFNLELLIYYIFGIIIGSYTSVLIIRTSNNKIGIVNGDSECPVCNKKLSFTDLLPIIGYLKHGGKCSKCKNIILDFYFKLEITFGTVLVMLGMLSPLIESSLVLNIASILIYTMLFGIFSEKYIKSK